MYVYVHLVRLGKCVCGCQAAHTFSRCSVIGYVALFGDSQEFEADPCVVRQLLKGWTPHLLD